MRTKKSLWKNRTKITFPRARRLHVYSCSGSCLSSFTHEEIDSHRNINLIYLIGRTLFISSAKFICNPHNIAHGSVCRLRRWYFLRVHFPLSISSFPPWLPNQPPIISIAFAYCFFLSSSTAPLCNHVDEACVAFFNFLRREVNKKICVRGFTRDV